VKTAAKPTKKKVVAKKPVAKTSKKVVKAVKKKVVKPVKKKTVAPVKKKVVKPVKKKTAAKPIAKKVTKPAVKKPAKVVAKKAVAKKSVANNKTSVAKKTVPQKTPIPATKAKTKTKKITNAFNFTTELDFNLMKETIEKAKASISKATMDTGDYSIEQKLVALFSLQLIDSEIDKIRIIRGELPLEVQDLEDEITGLETRLNRFKAEIEVLEKQVVERKTAISDAKAAIKKYETQQNKVRNNREYDSLTKEIEFQNLEIQLQDKRIKEANWQIEQKKKDLEILQKTFEERSGDLMAKKAELDEITAETEIEERELLKVSNEHKKKIEPRLISSYDKIRENARNGLAVVAVERDACGGCFNKIPPQRQAEIKLHKKILVCEHCGRILLDESIRQAVLGN
jgi:predicted  nucleic acid-binding Zn-ribbon protein